MRRTLRACATVTFGSALVLALLFHPGISQAQPKDDDSEEPGRAPDKAPPEEGEPKEAEPKEAGPKEAEPPPPLPVKQQPKEAVDNEEPPAPPPPARPASPEADQKKADEEAAGEHPDMNGVFLGATLLFPFKNQSEMAVSASPSSTGSTNISLSLPTYPVRLLVGYRVDRFVPYLILSLDHQTVSSEVERRGYSGSQEDYTFDLNVTSFMGGAGTRFHVLRPAPGKVSLFLLGEFVFILGFGSTSHSNEDKLSEYQKKVAEEMADRFWSQFKWIGFRAGVGGEYHVARQFSIGVSGGLLYLYNWDKADTKEMEIGSSTYTFYGYDVEHHVLNFFASVDLNIYF